MKPFSQALYAWVLIKFPELEAFCMSFEKACKKLLSVALPLLEPPRAVSRLLKLCCNELREELDELDAEELLLADDSS